MTVDWTVVITEGFKNAAAIIAALATLAIALGTLVNTVLVWRAGSKLDDAKKKIDENTELTATTGKAATENAAAAKHKVEELGKQINGRMDELLKAERAKGIAEGIERAAALALAAKAAAEQKPGGE